MPDERSRISERQSVSRTSPARTATRCFCSRCACRRGTACAHSEHNHEAFYVLEGSLEVTADGKPYDLGPGDFLSVRPGVLHSLKNAGTAWVRALTWVSPGSQHVRFFERLGEPIDDPRNPPQPSGPPDLEELVAVARDCGMEFQAP